MTNQINKKSPAGRKPIEDKKVTINLFVRQSIVEKLGGKESVQELSYDAITLALKGIA